MLIDRNILSHRYTTEPVDNIYALLSILHPIYQRYIRIDYATHRKERYWEVFIEACHVALMPHREHEHDSELLPDWDILCVAQETLGGDPARHPKLPSWCPNLHTTTMTSPLSETAASCVGTPFGSLPFHYVSAYDKRSITIFGLQIAVVRRAVKREYNDYKFPLLLEDSCKFTQKSYDLAGVEADFFATTTGQEASWPNVRDLGRRVRRVLIAHKLQSPNKWNPDQETVDQGFFVAMSDGPRPLSSFDMIYYENTLDKPQLRKRVGGRLATVSLGRAFLTATASVAGDAMATDSHSSKVFGLGPGTTKEGDRIVIFPTLEEALMLEDVSDTIDPSRRARSRSKTQRLSTQRTSVSRRPRLSTGHAGPLRSAKETDGRRMPQKVVHDRLNIFNRSLILHQTNLVPWSVTAIVVSVAADLVRTNTTVSLRISPHLLTQRASTPERPIAFLNIRYDSVGSPTQCHA